MAKKPNIIFILTDDQGAWAMHCAGNSEIQTPNLDRLAKDGMRFSSFFCASPVCSPARASILTGCIPSQHGVHDWIRSGNLNKNTEDLQDKINDPYYANETQRIQYLQGLYTYTDMLAENGYNCALAGKWHLGDSLTPQHSFSKWFTIGRGGCLYYKADIVENGRIYYENRYITDVITDKAIEYIDELGKQEKPYYISVHYTAPHDPWDESQHPKEFVELYRNCEFKSVPDLPIHPNQTHSAPYGRGEERKSLLRGYYAAISAMDAGVGKICDRLRETGEYDNTIIIFTADNGMNTGHHGIWGKGNGTFPLNMYDSAVKVPFIIAYPNKIDKNKEITSMHSHYDIIHTLADLLEIDAKLPNNLPGSSFNDVLNGAQREKSEIVIFDEYGPNRMIRTDDWKYIKRYPYGPDELYDLINDKDENNNLIDNKNYDEVKENLNARLSNWFNKYADPAIDGAHEGVTGFGQLCRAGIYANGKKIYGDVVKD